MDYATLTQKIQNTVYSNSVKDVSGDDVQEVMLDTLDYAEGKFKPTLIPFSEELKVDKYYLSVETNRYTQSADINLTVDKTDAVVGGGGKFELKSDGSNIMLTTDFSTIYPPSGATVGYGSITLPAGLYEVSYFWTGNKLKLGIVEFVQIDICSQIVDLRADSITDNSADISWTELSFATSWELEYGPPGHTPGTGIIETVVGSPSYQLQNLSSTTEYDIYVRGYCGSTYGQMVIVSFATFF